MSVEDANVVESWEEAEDSGELDRQLEQLRLSRERSAAAAAAPPPPRIMVRVQAEGTQYVPSAPPITILKRPEPAGGPGRPARERARAAPKSLQQREAEYAEARQRILGSSGDAEKSKEPERAAPVALLRPKEAPLVERQPRGPDGTAGFQLKR